ncbi:MAG: hypothetical protein B7Z66_04565 [Chromatiales bacterium 21-64-14]|nr:MAG: hypothetical protein B7Z66_04565 [Chromatiales bacterium 21-64-14]HQU14602.1 hypothetical protein [Gammaproteobacteria bacterium]
MASDVIRLDRERSRRKAAAYARAYRRLAYRFPQDSLYRDLVFWVSDNFSREAASLTAMSESAP